MVADVSRAFLEALIQRAVCEEPPPEPWRNGEDKVGLLVKSLYGTRDAAAKFQKEVKKVIK